MLPLEDPPGGMPLLARRGQVLPQHLTGNAIACRTVRRCTSYLRASARTGMRIKAKGWGCSVTSMPPRALLDRNGDREGRGQKTSPE